MQRTLCLALWLAWSAHAAAPPSWPEVALPDHATRYAIGPQMEMNGLPMRLTGFASPRPPGQMLAWFRHSLGQPLMDNRLGAQRILGRAQGEHYITVHIEPDPSGSGSRGIVAVTHLRAALHPQPPGQQERTRWQHLLPAGSEIGSLLHAQEDGRRSTHLVASNRHGEQVNAQRLTAALQERGYALENRFDDASGMPGITLLLRGPGKEATAVIHRDAQGLTRIVVVTRVAVENRP